MKARYILPPLGHRIMKSVAAIGICYLISFIRGDSGIVFYSHLAALWCIQTYVSNTKKMAKQRTIGTLIGAAYGLFVLLIKHGISLYSWHFYKYIYALFMTLMVGVVLYTTVCIKKKNASYFSCVVFLSIVVNHIEDQNPYLFVWNRFLDTMIGIVVGMGVNRFSLPREKHTDILFISGLDDTLLSGRDNMSDYSRVELNRILDEGAKFTISTMRTPAAIIDVMSDIRLKLPVISMDGAALYDLNEHRYIKTYVISNQSVQQITAIMDCMEIHYFVNAIVDDMLIIYYQDSEDEVYQNLVRKLRRSPYRNYVKRKLPEDEDVIYLMILEKKETIERLYEVLLKQGYTERFKIMKYPSDDYKGYCYIKIYNKNAGKEHMTAYLKKMINVEKTVTFGSVEGKYDVVIENGDSNQVVKTVKKMFEPYKHIRK